MSQDPRGYSGFDKQTHQFVIKLILGHRQTSCARLTFQGISRLQLFQLRPSQNAPSII